MATTSVSRVVGAGGENCQCSTAVPGATAQMPTWATRNVPPHPVSQLLSAPDAYANEPGSTAKPRNTHGLGPLHTSFCKLASNIVRSPVTVFVGTQAGKLDIRTFCIN